MHSQDDVYGGRSKLAVAARLELTRSAINIDKGEFASRVGIGASTYSNILAGMNYPSIPVIFAICDKFGIDPNWILMGDPGSLRHSFADLLYRLHTERSRRGD